MRNRRSFKRYSVAEARVAWQDWSFWYWFRSGRLVSCLDAFPVANIGLSGLGFATIKPPEAGGYILMNVFLPECGVPHVLRGRVAWIGKADDWSPYSCDQLRGNTFGVGVQFIEPARKVCDLVSAVWREQYAHPRIED